jgi:hypothetical protein
MQHSMQLTCLIGVALLHPCCPIAWCSLAYLIGLGVSHLHQVNQTLAALGLAASTPTQDVPVASMSASH